MDLQNRLEQVAGEAKQPPAAQAPSLIDPWLQRGATSNASTSSGPGTALAIVGGFPKDSQKHRIETKVNEILTSLQALSMVTKFYAPGKRASVCFAHFSGNSELTPNDALWKVLKQFKELNPAHEGNQLWFAPH